MKKRVCGLLCAAALFVPTWAHALEVTFLAGNVSIEREGTKVAKVNVGTKILANDVVKTGKKSLLTMTYTDGSEIQMTENSTV
ncbi:MAG TPA: hypothetical protein VF857_00110, partial [Spirochaetota bacterium]